MTERDDMRERALDGAREAGRIAVGAEEWRRSKAGYLIGATAFTGAFSSLRRVAGGAVSRFGNMAGIAALTREGAPPLPTDSAVPEERFATAMEMYGRTVGDVDRIVDETRFRARLYAALFLVACVYGAVLAWFGGGLPGFIGKIWPFVLLPALGALTVRAAFYNFQMRTRALHPVGRWIGRPAEWLPRKAVKAPPSPPSRGRLHKHAI